MFALTQAMDALRVSRHTYNLASCWRLTRSDGTILRFTNHDGQLAVRTDPATLGTIETFTPVGSFSASATQKLNQLRDRNLDIVGLFDATQITFDDLMAGKYRGAKIDEFLVDWRHPWGGYFGKLTYYVGQTSFNGEFWEATVEGLTSKLKSEQGYTYVRPCRWGLGRVLCGIDLTLFTFPGTVTVVVDDHLSFQSSLTDPDNYYNFGEIKFLTGLNAGVTLDIAYYVNALGGMQLFIPTSQPIQVGDTFNATAGCDRGVATCNDKFNNIVNYGGFPTIPGTDVMLQTPNAKLG